jgi:hypothetical protein
MASIPPEDLEIRFALLEQGLRRWKRATASMGVVLALVSGAATLLAYQQLTSRPLRTRFGEITASRFIAIDKRGNQVAVLGDLGSGAMRGLLLFPAKLSETKRSDDPSLKKLFQEWFVEDHASGLLTMGEDVAVLLSGRGPKDNPSFAVNLEGGPKSSSLILSGKRDGEGKTPSLTLRASDPDTFQPGDASISAASREGRTATLEAKDGKVLGSASLEISDPIRRDEKHMPRRVELNLSTDGTSQLKFFNGGENQQEADLSIDPENSPSLNLYDASGDLRATLGSADLEKITTGVAEKTTPSSLTLFDKEGRVFWRTP